MKRRTTNRSAVRTTWSSSRPLRAAGYAYSAAIDLMQAQERRRRRCQRESRVPLLLQLRRFALRDNRPAAATNDGRFASIGRGRKVIREGFNAAITVAPPNSRPRHRRSVNCPCNVCADEAPVEAPVHVSPLAEIVTEHFQLGNVAMRRAAFTTALDKRSASDPLPYRLARYPTVVGCRLVLAVVRPGAQISAELREFGRCRLILRSPGRRGSDDEAECG